MYRRRGYRAVWPNGAEGQRQYLGLLGAGALAIAVTTGFGAGFRLPQQELTGKPPLY